jgi:hypothetical protein
MGTAATIILANICVYVNPLYEKKSFQFMDSLLQGYTSMAYMVFFF